jgi:hypothetical protein
MVRQAWSDKRGQTSEQPAMWVWNNIKIRPSPKCQLTAQNSLGIKELRTHRLYVPVTNHA